MGTSLPPLRIPITTTGDAAVLRTFGRIGNAGAGLEKQFAKASLRVASIGTAAIQAGEVGGSALTKLTSLGASLALTMGIGGPVVAALGVAAITMVGFFDRARKEMEETRKKFDEEYKRIAKGGSFAEANRRAVELYSGDPFAETERERLGVKGLRERRDAALKEIERIQNSPEFKELQERAKKIGPSLFVGKETIPMREMLDPARQALKEIEGELAKIEPQQQRMHALSQKLAATEVERAETARETAKWLKEQDPAKRAEAIAKEIAAIVTLAKLHKLQGVDLLEMEQLERALTAEIARGNVTRERRAAIEQQLAALADTRRDMFGTPGETGPRVEWVGSGLERQGQAPKTGPIQGRAKEPFDRAALEIQAEAEKFAEHDAKQAGMVMGNAIIEGLDAAFSGGGIGAGLATFGGNLLSGLGRIMAEMGMKIGLFGQIMQRLQAAILANPILAGGAAIVAGAALMALGKSLGGTVRSGGSAGGSFGSAISSAATDSITNIRISTGAVDAATGLTPKQPINVTLIGPGDPVAQRQLWELLNNGRSRGYGA